MSYRICQVLDLIDDPDIIQKYEVFHQDVWPEVTQPMYNHGIESMEIYRVGNRLFMIMEVKESFNQEKYEVFCKADPTIQRWEKIMSTLQQVTPWSTKNKKWARAKRIFSFSHTKI